MRVPRSERFKAKEKLTVENAPLSMPTIVVVSAEFTMVHKNMVKLSTTPMKSEEVTMARNVGDADA